MHTAMMLSFQDELEKIASHAAELAGLGILAAPSAAHLGGKEWSEKNKSRAEVAGLGVLAGPSALAVGKKAVGKSKAVLRAANVNKLRKAATEVAKHAGSSDTEEEYSERSHRAGKAGALVGAYKGAVNGFVHSNKRAAYKVGGTALGALYGAGVGGVVGKGAHRAIYGHRKPKKKEAATEVAKHAGLNSTDMRQIKDVGKSALSGGAKALGFGGAAYLGAKAGSKKKEAATEVAKHAGVKDFAKKIYNSDKALHRTQGFAAGTLSAVGAKALGDKLKKKREDRLKKEAAPSMSAMMNMHRLADAAKAAKGAVKPAAQAAVKMPSQAAHAARAQQLAGHAATGGHAWNPAAQAKRAIPL